LGGRKGIRPVKTLSDGVLVWLSICLEQGADLHVAQLMPLTVSCFSKIQIGFTFLVPAHLGSPGQRAANVLYGTEECGRAYFGICVYIIASAIRIIANFRTFQDIALRFPGISRSWKFYNTIPGLCRRRRNPVTNTEAEVVKWTAVQTLSSQQKLVTDT